MSYTSLTQTGQHYSEMIKGLEFYKEELERMKLHLLEVAGKNTGFEPRQGMEHFEAQLALQRTRIDELRHDVHGLYQKLANDAVSHAGKVRSELVDADRQVYEQYGMQEKIMHDLREEFNRFLSKWM